MQREAGTVITTRPAGSERWAAWIAARHSFETPLLALVLAIIAWATPAPEGYSGIQMFLAGLLVATSFYMWERKGFRELLSRQQAELTRLKERDGSA
jgi:hypothetical protein